MGKTTAWTEAELEQKAPAPPDKLDEFIPRTNDIFPLRGWLYRVKGVAPGPDGKSLALWVDIDKPTKAIRQFRKGNN